MIKIFLTVRNRLAITKKCIESLKKHSKITHQIYIYNNQTDYLLQEHFQYFYELYRDKQIANLTFTTDDSTFNAFSKAVTCNLFGHHHLEDPDRDKYFFLVFLDNDMIVTPGWDEIVCAAWKYVSKNKMDNIKVISQVPGGIKNIKQQCKLHNGVDGYCGFLGGSGFWTVKNNFFEDVGFLNIQSLIGQNKKHDQLYWIKLQKSSNGLPYILGLKTKLAIHCGGLAGSVCNTLARNRQVNSNMLKFEEQEKYLDSMSFEEFYQKVISDNEIKNEW